RTQVTKAPKLRKESGQVDRSRPAQAIHNLVRALQPWPIAFTNWDAWGTPPRRPVRLIIHKTAVVAGQGAPGAVIEAAGDRLVVAAGENAVRILVLQLPGKKPFTAAEFLRGYRIQVGEILRS